MLTREQIEMIVWHTAPMHGSKTKLVDGARWKTEREDDLMEKWLEKKDLCWSKLTAKQKNDLTYAATRDAHNEFAYKCSEGALVDEKEWKETGPFYVVCQREDQCYGGPEEGGWYYHRPSLVKWCAVPTHEMAVELQKTLTAETQAQPEYRPRFQELGGDDTVNSTYPEGFIPRGWVGSRNFDFYVTHEVVRLEFQTPHYE